MRVFHLTAKEKTAAHPDWNGCTLDRRCQAWVNGDEARARELAHQKFWQEATPVDPDPSSPWKDPDMVDCEETEVLPGMPVPVDEAVFSWEDRVPTETANQNTPPGGGDRRNEDPSKKLDQR